MIFITRWLFLGMRWLFSTIETATQWQSSYVVALTILIATLLIKGVTVFSDIQSRKSTYKMQAIQPDLDKLKKKYEHDPQRLNVEQRKLMKNNNVSMLGGCLPLLIMMPLFFWFFSAFRAWSNEQTLSLLLTLDQNPELGLETFKSFQFFWINNIWRPDNLTALPMMTGQEFWSMFTSSASGCLGNANTNINNFIFFQEHEEELRELLVRMNFFVQNADGTYAFAADNTAFLASYAELTGECAGLYEGYVNGSCVLPILAAGIAFLSMWLTARGQVQTQQNQTSKIMNYVMPLFMGYICWNQNSTFALYLIFSYLISTLITICVNKALKKKFAPQVVEVKK